MGVYISKDPPHLDKHDPTKITRENVMLGGDRPRWARPKTTKLPASSCVSWVVGKQLQKISQMVVEWLVMNPMVYSEKNNTLNKSEPSLYVGLLLSFTLCFFVYFCWLEKQAFLASTSKQISKKQQPHTATYCQIHRNQRSFRYTSPKTTNWMEHEKDSEFRSSSFWGFRTSDVSNEKNRSGGGSVDPYNLTSDEVLSLICFLLMVGDHGRSKS